LWLATGPTSEVPGASRSWKLIVKGAVTHEELEAVVERETDIAMAAGFAEHPILALMSEQDRAVLRAQIVERTRIAVFQTAQRCGWIESGALH
jgi:hypothetical protein